MNGKWLKRTGIVILALALVIAGCSGKSSSSESSGGQQAGGQSNGTGGQPDGRSNGQPGPTYGGVLKIASLQRSNVLGLPSQIIGLGDSAASAPALERIARYDSEGNLTPYLVEGWEEDPQASTITFQIRKGVKFHDGTEFNAEALKFNIELYQESGDPTFDAIKGFEIVDDYTLVLQLSPWSNNTLDAFAMDMQIISPTAYETYGPEKILEHPVGTGPFQFVKWDRGERIVFEKFEDYWQEGLPYLDRIEIYEFDNESTASAAVQSGEMDVLLFPSPFEAHNLGSLPDFTVLTLMSGAGAPGDGIVFDTANPDSPFSDVNVRKAISYAVDRQAMVNSLMMGYAVPSNQFTAPGTFSYNDQVNVEYDLEKAKSFMAQSRYPNGFRANFTVRQGREQQATAVQGFLAELGIILDLNVLNQGAYNDVALGINNNKWDGVITHGFRSHPRLSIAGIDAHFSDNAILYGHNIMQIDELNSLIRELTSASTEREREIAHEIQRLIYDEHALGVVFYISGSPAVVHNSVKDSGFNTETAVFWSPERTWLDR